MNIISDESWREETAPYLPRLSAANKLTDSLHDAFAKFWPGCFFATSNPTAGAAIALKLGVYATNVFNTSLQISREVENQWRQGLFILVPMGSRFLIESWGAVHFSRATLDRLIKENNIVREESRVNRLTFGSRLDKLSEVQLPFINGGKTTYQSFNVMCFIDALSEYGEVPKEAYNFLSEACHPNFIQSTYFQLAGPPLSNWKNDSYKAIGHQLLEKTVMAIELAASGLQADVAHILARATRYISTEMNGCEA